MSMALRVKNAFWLIGFVILVVYGVLAFNSGTYINPLIAQPASRVEVFKDIKAKADAGQDVLNTTEGKNNVPAWVHLVAKVSNDKHALGSDGIADVEIYYLGMPKLNQLILSLHMMLGVFIMGFGFIQFWPQIRRKHRKLHRISGSIYMIVGVTSMMMSGYHLIVTPVEHIFNGLIFYVGLWIMWFGVLASMAMATYYLIKKRYDLHMGWQTLGFSFFLTAPIQRIDWIVFAAIFPHTTFIEANIIVDVILFAQVLLIGYFIFIVNRQTSPLSVISTEPFQVASLWQRKLWVGAVGIILLLAIYQFVLVPGLQGAPFAADLIPQRIINHEQSIYASAWLPILFVFMLFGLLVSHLKLTLRSQKNIDNLHWAKLLIGCAIGLAAIQFVWGWMLGAPSHVYSVAGVLGVAIAVLLLVFSALAWRSLHQKNWLLFDEQRLFLVGLAIVPILTNLSLIILKFSTILSPKYMELGQGYELACTAGLFLPMLLAFFAAMYGAETKRYRVN